MTENSVPKIVETAAEKKARVKRQMDLLIKRKQDKRDWQKKKNDEKKKIAQQVLKDKLESDLYDIEMLLKISRLLSMC